MASALNDASLLRAYVTPVATGHRLQRLAAALPDSFGPLPSAVLLRPPPERVAPEMLLHTGTSTELARVLTGRSRLLQPGFDWVDRVAMARFDRGVGRLLRPQDGALVGLTTASLDSFRRAAELGIVTFLDYPTVHHDHAAQLMTEEARRVPDYAFSIQTVAAGPVRRTRADLEVGLADRIIVNSGLARLSFLAAGIAPDRLIVAPFGVDLDRFVPAAHPRRQDGCFRVLFAGQITQRKGLSYLLDGFARAAMPGSELLLVGRVVGEKRPWRSQHGVVHQQPVPHHALPAIYQRADVFVLPSLFEGFPQTVLEAMASGLPVIVSENTVGEDVITDGIDGYRVPIRDPDMIANRLRQLYHDPGLRERIGLAARRRAEAFSWERYGADIVKAISELLPTMPSLS